MAVSKQPSITPETSSGEGLDEEPTSRGEAKWKRFHPFRVVRKIFRRRVKRQGGAGESTSKKSWSTSELQSVQDTPHKYEVASPPYKIGLSVSHDSIFSSESSNVVGHEELGRPQGSSLSVQHAGVKTMFKDELFSRVHARRDSDDDDEDIGLPHSPCNSPTTVDVLGLKSKPSKSGSLSAGSLISMESSENDEDSAVASSSGNSSRMSLLDRRSLDFEGDLDLPQAVVPLNHQAAHHKIAVRPKRKHALPQKRLKQKAAASKVSTLPTTPEVTEDNVKVYVKSETSESSSTVISHENLSSIIGATLLESRNKTASMSSEMEESEVISKTSHFQVSTTEKSSQMSEMRCGFTFHTSTVDEFNNSSFNIINVSRVHGDTRNSPGFDQNVNRNVLNETMSDREVLKTAETSSETSSFSHNINLKACNFFEGASVRPQVTMDDQQNLPDVLQQVPLRVSALIKNIEHTDSVMEPSKDVNPDICIKQSNVKHDTSSNRNSIIKSVNEYGDETAIEATRDSSNLVANNQNITELFHSTSSSLGESAKQVTSITNAYRHSEVMHLSDEKQLEMDIRQQFEQQKGYKNQDANASVIPRLFPEEESIMSEKWLPSANSEKATNNIIVSHHASQITEACNLLTVDKSIGVNRKVFDSPTFVDPSTKTNKEHCFIGSDVSTTPSDNISSVTIGSLTSSTSSQKKSDEKVTVSVKHTNEQTECSQPTTERANKRPEIAPLLLSSTNKPNKSETAKPSLQEKGKARPKTSDSSKRVSVEIVPFNQRLKEGKYQPLLFQNKDSSNSSLKDSSSSVLSVERNLSERRANSKNKDTANNRHSFSGVLSTDIERPTEKKQVSKTAADKLHYPVQIRIHKGKGYEKENLCEKIKNNKEIIKSPSPERISDARNSSNENQAKWEVRVQSTSLTKRGSFTSSNTEAPTSKLPGKLSSEQASTDENQEYTLSMANRNEKGKISPSLPESSLLKSKENTKKVTKENSSSGDPEPELMRVFARRSIKQKHCDKEKPGDKKEVAPVAQTQEPNDILNDGDKPASAVSQQPVKHVNLPEPAVSTLKSPELVKKKSKSFCEKEKHGPHIITSAKEITLNRRPSLKVISPQMQESENFHRRQRMASEPDVLPLLPSLTDNVINNRVQQSNISCENTLNTCHNEHLSHTMMPSSPTTLSNGSSLDALKLKESDLSRDPSAPSWLQLAQQRRELREQRERLLIGSSTNSFLEASGKPSRSSKVWDMVNNFQKMQMT